jgi:hypothetical protein
VAHAPAKTAITREAPPAGTTRLCAECLAPLTGVQPGTLFCTKTHRKAFQQRMRVRGRQIQPFVMADRMTRSGTAGTPEAREVGKAARVVTQRLVALWVAEDKAAGRMPMVDYVARLSKHFELPL